MVVCSDEVVEDGAPLLRTLAVSGALAGEHQRAADVRERLERGGLTARRRSHRLVEPSEAAVGLSQRHLREAELRQRAELEIQVAGDEGDVERREANDAASPGRAPLRSA